MTVITDVNVNQVVCAICQYECEVIEAESAGGEGPSDLDLRIAGPARSNLRWCVQMCPYCGYSSDTIYEAYDGAEAVVKSEEFTSLCDGTSRMHPVVRAFRHAAYLSNQLNDLPGAFWFTLFQAWTHDDLGKEADAMATRLVAANLLKQIHDRGEQALEQDGFDTLMNVDLLRRAGKFAQAAAACQTGLTECRDENAKEVLVFQINLCEKEDRGCHTMAEVFQPEDMPDHDA